MRRIGWLAAVVGVAFLAWPCRAQGPVLRVGVRELPQGLWPGQAVTDSERRAVELMFEGLVRVSAEPGGSAFRPALADGPPRLLPQGRLFQLPRWPARRWYDGRPLAARWSNGDPITAADVQASVRLLREGKAGRPKAYARLLEEVVINTPDQAALRLTQGYLEPLSLMTFKVVPQSAARAMTGDPVGSGPYRFRSSDRDAVVFEANPYYFGRGPAPHFGEIHFVRSADPVADLRAGKLHLALDLTPDQAWLLRDRVPRLDPKAPAPASNRRVFFLAVNHNGDHPLLGNAEFRRMLAYAVPRAQLLDRHFRATQPPWWRPPAAGRTLGPGIHKVLNGPFPADSWANAPALKSEPADLYEPQRAAGLANKLLVNDAARAPLKLKYPAGDPSLAAALAELAASVRQATGLEIDLKGLDPHALREDVDSGRYQLAYDWYDYPDDTCWLEPLLGAGNRFAYNSADMQTQLQRALEYREFRRVSEAVHEAHVIFSRDLPFVPLWQLDPLTAIHPGVKAPEAYDPWLLFGEIDRWDLRR